MCTTPTDNDCQRGFACIPPKYQNYDQTIFSFVRWIRITLSLVVYRPLPMGGAFLLMTEATSMLYPSIACDMFLCTILFTNYMFLCTILFTNYLTNLAFGILHLFEMITNMMGRLKMAP